MTDVQWKAVLTVILLGAATVAWILIQELIRQRERDRERKHTQEMRRARQDSL